MYVCCPIIWCSKFIGFRARRRWDSTSIEQHESTGEFIKKPKRPLCRREDVTDREVSLISKSGSRISGPEPINWIRKYANRDAPRLLLFLFAPLLNPTSLWLAGGEACPEWHRIVQEVKNRNRFDSVAPKWVGLFRFPRGESNYH